LKGSTLKSFNGCLIFLLFIVFIFSLYRGFGVLGSLIADLKKGGKFEDLAKKASKDPGSGANGGDLDWASAASYVPEFSNAMIKLEKGQLTETPVKSQFGFHIIRVDDVREAQLPPLDEVKPQITQQLTQSKLGKFQEDLRAKAKVK
jgi:peptidyl-prolyl cis-trans isomerase C